jgi:hypothetical protein
MFRESRMTAMWVSAAIIAVFVFAYAINLEF